MADAATSANGESSGEIPPSGTMNQTMAERTKAARPSVPGSSINSKRKRADTASSDAVVIDLTGNAPPLSENNQGPEERKAKPTTETTKSAKKAPTKKKIKKEEGEENERSPTVRRPDEWPEWLRALNQTHRALNLVFTFCCTRKHLLTTFATIRATVEANTQTPLHEADVAAIACILAFRTGSASGVSTPGTSTPGTVTPTGTIPRPLPGSIHFAYVDELSLQLDIQGAERDETFKTGRTRGRITTQGPASDASVGGITGRQTLGASSLIDVPSEHRQVLYFEFVDEDLKREMAHPKTGEPTKSNRMLRDEQLKLPQYSQKQMMALMKKRNHRFVDAVNAFLDRCETAQDNDPAATLRREAEAFIPVPPDEAEDTTGQVIPSTAAGGKQQQQCEIDTSYGIPPRIPEERKSISEIVQELKESPWYSGQIVPDGHRVFEEQDAVYGELDFLMSQDLVDALYNAKGITQFYAHQAQAINALHAGRNVVVATSTSSGKSLIFQLPVVHALEQDHQSRALYIFPTKALAQDQKRSLRDLLAYMPGLALDAPVETFDGDTPWKERNAIRENARVIFTNPDMLHITILPQEERWRSFLQALRFVVVDELHYYNGLMGSHMAFIMRRLRRVCAAVGNDRVQFVSCSATVANPVEHFETIFGSTSSTDTEVAGQSSVELVDFDGSPSGRKEFLCWNTPFRVPGDPASGRGSGLQECARLFCELILRGVRVIAFCRVREQCEKLVQAVQNMLEARGRPECTTRVMGYRGGYTPQDRRRIEADMFEGRLVGIVATSALELGVDIGTLDCVITWGFPYTIANLRQQSGRAGRRRGRDSLSVLVGDAFATDQHYMQNPDQLFDQPNGALQVDLDNLLVREGHIQCAAHELPIEPVADERYFGPGLAQLCKERLTFDDQLGFYHCHDHFRPHPWKLVAIRDTEDEHFAIVDVGRDPPIVLEELEASRATFTLYDGAIFLHQGATYLVKDFDPGKHMARVERVRVDWLTQQRDYTDVDPIETQAVRRIGAGGGDSAEGRARRGKRDKSDAGRAYLGRVRITQQVFGYFKVDKRERILDAVQVDNPPVIRHSKGTWVDVPASGLAVLARRRLHFAAAIHAAEHAVLGLLPTFVISLPGDVRTECKSHLKEFQDARKTNARKRPARLTFYDAKGGAGGTGMSAKAFDFVDVLLRQALDRVEGCACAFSGDADSRSHGCPECVVSHLCSESNSVLSKAGAIVVLRSLLGLSIDEEALPMGPEEGIPAGPETIVLAQPVPGVREVDRADEDSEAAAGERNTGGADRASGELSGGETNYEAEADKAKVKLELEADEEE